MKKQTQIKRQQYVQEIFGKVWATLYTPPQNRKQPRMQCRSVLHNNNTKTYITRSSFDTKPNNCLVALLSKKLNVNPPCICMCMRIRMFVRVRGAVKVKPVKNAMQTNQQNIKIILL